MTEPIGPTQDVGSECDADGSASGATLPTGGRFPYRSGQQGNRPNKLPGNQGWKDADNNRWVWDPIKSEWDVQHPDGSHTNVGEDGEITHGANNFPSLPKGSSAAERVGEVGAAAVAGAALAWAASAAAEYGRIAVIAL